MLKAIGWVIKAAIFSVLVLILGNWLRIGGRTVSDQVRTQMSHAESSSAVSEFSSHVHGWAGRLTGDARKGALKVARTKEDGTPSSEEIPSSERQKLKALIRDLNTAR